MPPGAELHIPSPLAVAISTSELLAPPSAHRVPDAIDAGVDFVSACTFFGGEPTDIVEDLAIAAPGDLASLVATWGRCLGSPADFDGNDTVGPVDLAQLLAGRGACP